MSANRIVTIDGPAGAGKSTVARELARRLKFFFLDTGAIYRTVALVARSNGVDWSDEERVAAIAKELPLSFGRLGDRQVIQLGGEMIDDEQIRTPAISDGASRVSALPKVRAALLDLQRNLAAQSGCVAEGRDTGTVVFPHAAVKIFLTASPEERARRRHEELLARGLPSDLQRTQREMESRDERDSKRDVAPLKPALDAIAVDTTSVSLERVIERVEAIAREKLAGKIGP